MPVSPLADWSNFYVIVGSAAGGLTGLTFVVIALSTDANRVNPAGVRAFLTPTVVHFGTVLALAAYLSVPGQGAVSLSIGFATAGVVGLVYSAVVARSMGEFTAVYVPVREDWPWNVIAPALVYGGLLAMALSSWHRLEPALYGVALASVLPLFIGIRNAWDVAVWNSIRTEPGAR